MGKDYIYPEVLVSTKWVFEHLKDPGVRIIEVDVDTKAYDQGHIQNAIAWNWQTQLQDKVRRDVVRKKDFEALMAYSGISHDITIVLYGDNNNWFAAWAFWQLKYFGHKDVRLMNGGRKKWIEERRLLVTECPSFPGKTYTVEEPDHTIRARRDFIFDYINKALEFNLIDVRSPDEYSGKVIAPPGMTETAQRGGHIPGAKNIPWSEAVNFDGTFKTCEELEQLYDRHGINKYKEAVAYCRIGERSSHTWFVLKYLLGYPKVKNYDGSWTEWGNLVDAPIEKLEPVAAYR